MNDVTRIERELPGILADLGAGRGPVYVDTLLARTAATRQRPGWVFPERWLPMSVLTQRMTAAPRVTWRVVAVIALLVLALVSVGLYVGSQQRRLPAPFGPAANGLISYSRGGDLFVADPVTGQSRLLLGGAGADYSPQFSPDGTRVVFTRDVGATHDNPVDIYVVREDGSDLRKITSQPLANGRSVMWMPDGRGIAVAWTADTGEDKLAVDDADGRGTSETVFTAQDMKVLGFRPPDGRAILVDARVGDARGLYVIDLARSAAQLVLRSSDPANDDFWGHAAWSADGSKLFYTRPYEHPTASGTCCSLWVANADGTDARLFVPNDGTVWDGQPVVSPDGTWVAFWHVVPQANGGQVAVTRADGSGPVIPVGPTMTTNAVFGWAPDASKLLMRPDGDANAHATLLDPRGGPATTVPWESAPDLDWQRLAGS
jgi:Tol biopolymer transport system component